MFDIFQLMHQRKEEKAELQYFSPSNMAQFALREPKFSQTTVIFLMRGAALLMAG